MKRKLRDELTVKLFSADCNGLFDPFSEEEILGAAWTPLSGAERGGLAPPLSVLAAKVDCDDTFREATDLPPKLFLAVENAVVSEIALREGSSLRYLVWAAVDTHGETSSRSISRAQSDALKRARDKLSAAAGLISEAAVPCLSAELAFLTHIVAELAEPPPLRDPDDPSASDEDEAESIAGFITSHARGTLHQVSSGGRETFARFNDQRDAAKHCDIRFARDLDRILRNATASQPHDSEAYRRISAITAACEVVGIDTGGTPVQFETVKQWVGSAYDQKVGRSSRVLLAHNAALLFKRYAGRVTKYDASIMKLLSPVDREKFLAGEFTGEQLEKLGVAHIE